MTQSARDLNLKSMVYEWYRVRIAMADVLERKGGFPGTSSLIEQNGVKPRDDRDAERVTAAFTHLPVLANSRFCQRNRP